MDSYSSLVFLVDALLRDDHGLSQEQYKGLLDYIDNAMVTDTDRMKIRGYLCQYVDATDGQFYIKE